MSRWYGGMAGWGWLPMALGTVLSLAVLTAVVVVAILAVNRGLGRTAPWAHRSARDVLSERFARGEIDEEEYRRRLEVLEQHAADRRS